MQLFHVARTEKQPWNSSSTILALTPGPKTSPIIFTTNLFIFLMLES
jgi:hypothetical protein